SGADATPRENTHHALGSPFPLSRLRSPRAAQSAWHTLAPVDHPARKGTRTHSEGQTVVSVYPDSRTRSLYECECTHTRLDAVFPLCPQCSPALPVSHWGGILVDGARSGAETPLLAQTDHA